MKNLNARRWMIGLLVTGLSASACGGGAAEAGEASDAAGPAAVADTDLAARMAAGEDPVTLSVLAEGDRHEVVGIGECSHEGRAQIYGQNAALWRVEYSGDEPIRHVTLSVWRPASGGDDQFTMATSVRDRTHRISTVRGGTIEGEGTVAFHPQGQGGRFEIDGVTGEGEALRMTIQCTDFSPIVAEGG